MNGTKSEKYTMTDCGNARRFADLFKDRVKYDLTSGKWLVWDGRRWSREKGESLAQSDCRLVAGSWYRDLGNCFGDEKASERKRLFRHWEYTASATGIRNMLFLAKSELNLLTSAEELDSHPFLLNVLNGTIDLKTGKIKPHDPEDLITQLAPVKYEEGSVERWKIRLEEWHPKAPDTHRYLQQLMGYCLTGSTSSRCFPIFYGEGKNGKNIFLDTFLRMLGDYASYAPTTLLEAQGRQEHPTEIADLLGKRLVLVSEPKKGSKLRASLLKASTGDGALKARFLYRDFFSFVPTHKLVMLTNNLPTVDESTAAIWDRIHKVGWNERFDGDREIPKEQLLKELEEEWPGILRWAVEGYLSLAEGTPPWMLRPTERIAEATKEYRNEQNHAMKFVEATFERGMNLFCPSAEVNRRWTEWSMFSAPENSYLNRGDLITHLRSIGCTNGQKRVGGEVVRGWYGIGLKMAE